MDIGAYRDHFFRPFGPHFGLKIRWGRRGADPSGPSPGSVTDFHPGGLCKW